jgi:hypothetical protein
MATPRQLVETVAEVLGVSVATVIVHDRNLSTAPVPLRTVAGRGRAAAKITAVDAANLLIAVAASASVKDSVATVIRYRDLPVKKHKNSSMSGVRRYDDLPANHTFGQALAAFIDAAAAKEIPVSLSLFVKLFEPRTKARIDWNGDDHPGATYEPNSKLPTRVKVVDVGDLERLTSISEKTILRVGAAVGGAL